MLLQRDASCKQPTCVNLKSLTPNQELLVLETADSCYALELLACNPYGHMHIEVATIRLYKISTNPGGANTLVSAFHPAEPARCTAYLHLYKPFICTGKQLTIICDKKSSHDNMPDGLRIPPITALRIVSKDHFCC